MADHSDDTILDDELDENDFNFDNENEDDLLAENEYDLIEKSEQQSAQEIQDKNVLLRNLQRSDETEEQLEPEEDVLDIGIVDEYIVDSETVYLQEATVDQKDSRIESSVAEQPKYEERVLNSCEQTAQVNERTNDSVEDEEDKFFVVDSISSPVENEVNKNDIPDSQNCNDRDDKSSKSTVISLRKPVRKSYDDIPELAKVITSSKRSKSGQAPDNQSRKKRDTSEYEDRKKKEPSRHDRVRDNDRDRERDRDRDRDRIRDRDRDRDWDRRRSSGYRDDYSSASDEENNCKVVTSRNSRYYDSGNNYQDLVPGTFSYQQPLLRPADVPLESHYQTDYQSTVQQYQPEPPIIASVQITQERYQITSDFHVIRPMPPPPIMQQPPPSNSFDVTPNRPHFLQLPHPQPEPMQQPYPSSVGPTGVPGMPPQQAPFRSEPPMHIRPPPAQGFNPALSQTAQTPPPPQMSLRGPPIHLQRPPYPCPPRPHPAPMNRPVGFAPLMRPPPPHGRPLPPPHLMRPFIGQIRPHPNIQQRPPMMGPVAQNQPPRPPVTARQPQNMLQMPPAQNTFHMENGARMPPPIRPNVHPPQPVLPRPCEQPPPSVEYFSDQHQFMSSAPPPNSYQQCVNQPPPFAGRQPGQPPPPGVPTGQPMRNTYLETDRQPNEMNYSQYSQDSYYANQAPHQQYPNYGHSDDRYIHSDDAINHLKRTSSSIDGSPSKQARYNQDDEDMKLYQQKVESQKELREKFVQMKEEQRLKNQMQSFIQSNIKGILEKREQFRRKNELEIAKQAREVTKRIESMPTDDHRRSNSSAYSSTEHRSQKAISPVRRYDEPVRSREVSPKEKPKSSVMRNNVNNQVNVQRSAKVSKNNDTEEENDRRQLHKVVKITYKDGTVALKSIPVHSTSDVITKQNAVTRKIHTSDNLNVTIGGGGGGGSDDATGVNSHRRRMVISKQIPLPNVKNVLNENIIVESVRKGVTQSSVPLAQRFTNLRAAAAKVEDEEMGNGAAKSKNRLVIPDEDGSRTVWIKNITPGTNPALIQKIASTCGTVSRTNWLSSGSQATKQAKITFCKSEEAKKFCLNFNKKMIDSSLITVVMVSEPR